MARRRRYSEEGFGTTIESLMRESGVTYRELAARTVFMTGDVVGNALQAATASRQPVLVKPFALDKLEEVVAAMVREQSAALRG